jgi:putative transcriptional regulator
MITREMTDQAISQEIGKRIEQLRLESDLTQEEVANETGINRRTYINLVKGNGKFTNIISVLRVLKRLDLIENFISEEPFSPIELLKMKGRQRKRASNKKKLDKGEPEW